MINSKIGIINIKDPIDNMEDIDVCITITHCLNTTLRVPKGSSEKDIEEIIKDQDFDVFNRLRNKGYEEIEFSCIKG